MKNNKYIILSLLIILSLFTLIIFKSFNNKEVLSRNTISIIDTIYSPNKKYKCTIFKDNGSITVSENIRVSLTKSNKNKIYDSDIIFLCNRIQNVSINWKTNNNLIVSFQDNEFADVIKKISKKSNINIDYKNKID